MNSVFAILALAAAAAAQAPSGEAAAPVIPTGEALRPEIHALDAEFFRLMWKDCDSPEKLAAFGAPDLEFYHDLNGVRRGAGMAVSFQQRRCERERKTGERHRRELVEETFTVDPVPGFGAIATGEHRFYRAEKGKPERLLSTARFVTLWKLQPDGWKQFRVLSFAHRSPE
jgi:hypothetical protein